MNQRKEEDLRLEQRRRRKRIQRGNLMEILMEYEAWMEEEGVAGADEVSVRELLIWLRDQG